MVKVLSISGELYLHMAREILSISLLIKSLIPFMGGFLPHHLILLKGSISKYQCIELRTATYESERDTNVHTVHCTTLLATRSLFSFSD